MGWVIDPKLIERVRIFQIDCSENETLRLRQQTVGIGSGPIERAIRQGKIGQDVTSSFMTVIPDKSNKKLAVELFKVISLIENSLRKVIRNLPNRESEINDSLENLFIGAGLDWSFTGKRSQSLILSKGYIPDFVFESIGATIETKFCDREGKDKEIIGQINDDIIAYKQRYPNQIFVVYDIGKIRNVEMFKSSIEKQESVILIVIKH